MHANLPLLEKKAIKLALKNEWKEAIEVNEEILKEVPNDKKAKIRLGRAYLQTKNFSKALKICKQVLDLDPINAVARKNYDLALKKKTDTSADNANGKSLVKEPGTTAETDVATSNGTIKNLSHGTEFKLKILKHKAILIYEGKEVGEILDTDLVKRLNKAKNIGAEVYALLVKYENKSARVLIKSSDPIFKGDKQDIKPYMRKGSIDEPELEIESYEDEEIVTETEEEE